MHEKMARRLEHLGSGFECLSQYNHLTTYLIAVVKDLNLLYIMAINSRPLCHLEQSKEAAIFVPVLERKQDVLELVKNGTISLLHDIFPWVI